MRADGSRSHPAALRPFYSFLRLRFEDSDRAEQPDVVIDAREELENSRGNIHGGVLASVLDSALAVAARAQLPDDVGVATISMTVNFLKPCNGQIRARGRVIRLGKSIATVEAEATDSSGETVGHCVGTLRVIRPAAGQRRRRAAT